MHSINDIPPGLMAEWIASDWIEAAGVHAGNAHVCALAMRINEGLARAYELGQREMLDRVEMLGQEWGERPETLELNPWNH